MPTRAWPARISPRSACHRWTVPIRPQPYRTADLCGRRRARHRRGHRAERRLRSA
jgi:hypothetical protein